MVIAQRNLNYSNDHPRELRYEVLAAQVSSMVPKNLVGIFISGANKGKIRDYDPSVASLKYLGILNGDLVLEQDTSVYYGAVDFVGLKLKRATVAGSGSSAVGDPVYATGDDPNADLTITPAQVNHEPIAYLHEQTASSSTVWEIVFRPGYNERVEALGVVPGKVTEYTADGAITLPVEDLEAARLSGASSAAMTLAAPADSFVGKRFHIYMSGGTGTHDVDFTDEGGNAATYTYIADGDGITLLAVHRSTTLTGWRPI